MKKRELFELSKQEIEKLFNSYFQKYFPEKLKFNPTIIEYNNEIIKFGMKKHYGILNMSAEKILKN